MTPPASAPHLPDLPVTPALPEVRAALDRGRSAVLVAPPGAGKTTLAPLALLDEAWLGRGRVVVLEPRRLAARAAARRMATLVGEEGPGGTVGYRVRMDTRVGPRTRIEVVTEGVLTRMLLDDPGLAGVSAVIFDEFHERSVHADLGLALTLQARSLLREDLRILVMSATLEPEPVVDLLGDATLVTSEGRLHPVATRWRRRPVEGWIEPAAAAAVRTALEREEGDVLVFLPGAGEIRRTARRLVEGRALPPDVSVHPLYGNLSRTEQDRAVAPAPPGRRKVVLATSIAETSLTIEGVRVVVDGGLMRVPRFDPGTGMTRLETVRVTRDSADQRRGRAGRLTPGVCYRLWTGEEDRGLVPRRTPEILEVDLAPLALDLAVWGASPGELRWLDPPPAAAWAQARELLRELEALDGDGNLTDHGRRVAALGMHPRLAHMVVRGRELGLGARACDLAALLGGRDFLRAEGRAPDADLCLRTEVMDRARRGGKGVPATAPGQRVDRGGLGRALREAAHWRRRVGVESGDEALRPAGGGSAEDVGLLAAMAYPDRIGRRRPGGRGRYLLRGGRGARFAEPQPLAGEDWIVAAEVDGRGREARIFRAAPLEPDDIEAHFGDQAEEVREVVWDGDAGRVRARRRRMLGAIILSEAPLPDPDPGEVTSAVLEGVRLEGLGVLPWSKELRQLRERLAFLRRLRPDEWPDVSDEALLASLEEWLGPFVPGRRSLDDLERVDLGAALRGLVPPPSRGRLEAWAPTHVEVPSGSRIRVDYSDPGAPALAVRLQEVFGLAETPRVGGGRVPLVMRLLSPARRPVQVTRDLASFWKVAYHEVRKDLRGRYPKHFWPEDPMDAVATRGLRPR